MNEANETVAALDLGGGSTQLTFALSANEESKDFDDRIKHINVFGRNMSVFTQSFLGLGLMAARKEILTHPDNNNDYQSMKSNDPIKLNAECINPVVNNAEWKYAGKIYLISGPKNGTHKIVKAKNLAGIDEDVPIVRFSVCLDIIQKVINATMPTHLPSLGNREIYAFSYYFERATEVSNLIIIFKFKKILMVNFFNRQVLLIRSMVVLLP